MYGARGGGGDSRYVRYTHGGADETGSVMHSKRDIRRPCLEVAGKKKTNMAMTGGSTTRFKHEHDIL